MSAFRDISRMPPFGPKSKYINAIIETPKGSRTKFKYDEEHGLFMFDKALPIGQSFPFDFGFLPSTKGDDGDPLDVLVLNDEPTFVGCLVHAKLLGVIEAEQTENGETERNDRLIAVPLGAKSGKPPEGAIDHLEQSMVRKITKFFVAYNELQGKRFRALRYAGPERAEALIRSGISNFQKPSIKRSANRQAHNGSVSADLHQKHK
jgi:inorganic pyrophosphatase